MLLECAPPLPALISPLFSQPEACLGLYQPGMAGFTNQRPLRAQRINSADPGLAWVRHPDYQLCPRVLSFRLLVAGEVGRRRLISTELPAVRLTLNGAPHSPAGDPPGGVLYSRINSKPRPAQMALPTSLNSACSGHACLLSLPDSTHPHALALGLRHWVFLCLEPPSEIFKKLLLQVSCQKSRPREALPPHCHPSISLFYLFYF